MTPSILSFFATFLTFFSVIVAASSSSAAPFHLSLAITVWLFLIIRTRSSWNFSAFGPSKSSTTIRLRPPAFAVGHSTSRGTSTASAASHLLVEMIDLELVIGDSLLFRRGRPLPSACAIGHAAKQQREVRRTTRMLHRFFVADQALLHERRQALIERDHAVRMETLRDRILDLARAHRILDHLANALGVDHDLERRHHALAVGARQQ